MEHPVVITSKGEFLPHGVDYWSHAGYIARQQIQAEEDQRIFEILDMIAKEENSESGNNDI